MSRDVMLLLIMSQSSTAETVPPPNHRDYLGSGVSMPQFVVTGHVYHVDIVFRPPADISQC